MSIKIPSLWTVNMDNIRLLIRFEVMKKLKINTPRTHPIKKKIQTHCPFITEMLVSSCIGGLIQRSKCRICFSEGIANQGMISKFGNRQSLHNRLNQLCSTCTSGNKVDVEEMNLGHNEKEIN